LKWSERQDFDFPSLANQVPEVGMFASANCNHLRPPGPKPCALMTELRSE